VKLNGMENQVGRNCLYRMQLTPRLISSTHTHAVALTHSHTHMSPVL